jgi:dye decolorizing peroxidase
MMTEHPAPPPDEHPSGGHLTRRRLLSGGAAVAGGALLAGTGYAVARATEPAPPAADAAGSATEPFHGDHQAGIGTAPQAVGSFVAFDLVPGTDTAALRRLMLLWTEDARRLSQGQPTLADTEPELALRPARLTVTVGYGPPVFALPGLAEQRPAWLQQLPAFPTIDQLEPRWSAGALVVQLGADDPLALSHAQRMVVKSARPFATVRWVQPGFTHGAGSVAPGSTPRNLMGQVDGTANPVAGTPEFDQIVWTSDGPDWIRGGTGLVLRRIRMELDTWDAMERADKEQVIGRTLDNGAPLTGTEEFDDPDFDAVGADGLSVIPDFAHIRMAHSDSPSMKFLRRPFSYDDGVLPDGRPDVGLLFAAYAADLDTQFVPIQQRLAENDLFNTWTTPVGSAVFALPPGCGPDGYLGEGLLG